MVEISDKMKALINRLSSIRRDRDFVLALYCYMENDDDIDELNAFIDSNEWEHDYDLIIWAIRRWNTRYPPKEIDEAGPKEEETALYDKEESAVEHESSPAAATLAKELGIDF
jgi:hypothetical protein